VFGPVHQNVAPWAVAKSAIYDCYDLFGTLSQEAMPYGWEGNRRSGVALAMRHRLNPLMHKVAKTVT